MPFHGLSTEDQQALVESWHKDLEGAIRTIPNIEWVLSSTKCPGLTVSQRDGLIARLRELKELLNTFSGPFCCQHGIIIHFPSEEAPGSGDSLGETGNKRGLS
jgi:hypothetical protein